MLTDRDEVIGLLRELIAVNRAILAALGPNGSARTAAASKAVASDSDLDSAYGDPVIRGKDPKRWEGAPQHGRRYSQCPPEYLDVLAEFLDWQAEQADKKNERTNGGKPVSEYRRKDAARARGWAARIRAGKTQQPAQRSATPEEFEFASDSDFSPSDWG